MAKSRVLRPLLAPIRPLSESFVDTMQRFEIRTPHRGRLRLPKSAKAFCGGSRVHPDDYTALLLKGLVLAYVINVFTRD